MRGAAFVEHQRLPHPNPLDAGTDDLVPASGLPEPDRRRTVGASARGVLLVLVAEEVPVVLRRRPNPALLCFTRFDSNFNKRVGEQAKVSESALLWFTRESKLKYQRELGVGDTLDVPWLELVEVDVADDVEVDLLTRHLLSQVEV